MTPRKNHPPTGAGSRQQQSKGAKGGSKGGKSGNKNGGKSK